MNGLFIGLTTIDIQYFTKEFPKSNVKLKTAPPSIFVGGPATNASVIFSHLGGNANLVSPVGANPFSSFIKADLEKYDVKHTDPVQGEKVDPVIASVITSTNNGDRNIFTNNPPDIITQYNLEDLVKQARIVLVDGFFPDIAIKAVINAAEKHILVVMDGGSWKPQYNELLPFVDFAICSNDFIPPDCKNTNDVFEYLLNKGVKNVAITHGANSILWSQGDDINKFMVKQVNAVDTLGSGDFFHGAFTYSIANQNSFVESLVIATQIASESCKYQGTREWLNFIK